MLHHNCLSVTLADLRIVAALKSILRFQGEFLDTTFFQDFFIFLIKQIPKLLA